MNFFKLFNKYWICIPLLAFLLMGISSCKEEDEDSDPPVPTVNPESLTFVDKDLDEDQISGNLILTKAENEAGIAWYKLYWGESTTVILTSEPDPFAKLSVNGENHIYVFNQGSVANVPSGATHILGVSSNGSGNAADMVAIAINDKTLKLVANLNGHNGSSYPSNFVVMNGDLYFTGRDDVGYDKLWKLTPGSAPATIASGDSCTYNCFSNLVAFNNSIFFTRYEAASGTELWYLDSAGDPTLFKDIYVGTTSSNPSGFTVFKSKLYFSAEDAANGIDLWVSNGTLGNGTALDIATGALHSYPNSLAVVNGNLYFQAYDGTTFYSPWVTDGVAPAAIMGAGASQGVNSSNFVTHESKYYFIGGNRLRNFNAAGTTTLIDYMTSDGEHYLYPNSFIQNGKEIQKMTSFGGKLYHACSANEVLNNVYLGVELCSYDTEVHLIADINQGSGASSPRWMTVFDGKLFFAAMGELYSYSGTGAPTIFAQINPGGLSNVEELIIFDGKLYFRAENGNSGTELWVYYVK